LIGPATTALTRLGLIGPNQRVRFNIGLSRGSTIAADVSIDDITFLHLKATSHGSLEGEYDATLRAAAIHASVVPRPVAHFAAAGWQLMFTEGRQFVAMHARSLRSPQVVQALIDFLARAAATGSRAETGYHRVRLERCIARSSTPIPDWVLEPWTRADGAAMLDALPVVAQHGDFTQNNIGIAPRGIVVFDWADFGQVELPGFDLATLVMSLTGFDVERIGRLWQAHDDPLGHFVHAACGRLGLGCNEFRALLPLYLAVFLSLKSDYALVIRLKAAAALDELTRLHTRHRWTAPADEPGRLTG
jgi:hypothetical protein